MVTFLHFLRFYVFANENFYVLHFGSKPQADRLTFYVCAKSTGLLFTFLQQTATATGDVLRFRATVFFLSFYFPFSDT